jgi:Na+-driven multidrug efflux pump
MTAADPAGRRRCGMLVVAIALGLVLVVAGALDRGWASVVAGVVGSAVALVVYWRTCLRRPSGES